MKRKLFLSFLLLCAFFLVNSCALLSHKKINLIEWPTDIQYMEAVCELNVTWNNMQYSGDMSVKLSYPDTLFLEVYGPFGETVFSIQKKRDSLLIHGGNGAYTDESQFFDMFKMTIRDFIDDITLKGAKQQNADGTSYLRKEQYQVTYSLDNGENKICWKNPQGTLCIRFLEASFDRKG